MLMPTSRMRIITYLYRKYALNRKNANNVILDSVHFTYRGKNNIASSLRNIYERNDNVAIGLRDVLS